MRGLLLVSFFLFSLNLLFLFENQELRKKNLLQFREFLVLLAQERLGMERPYLQDLPLRAPSGYKEISLKEAKGDSRLLIVWFFSEKTCPTCLDEMEFLGRLIKEFEQDGLKVLGVTSNSPEETEALMKMYSPPFPIYLDGEKSLERMLTQKPTPFKIGILRDGRVVIADPVRLTEKGRAEFKGIIRRILRASENPFNRNTQK